MKTLKVILLGAILAVTGCMSVPHDPDAELNTMNKKMVVVAKEVESVIKTANDLYMLGMLPDGSREFKAVDKVITELVENYDKLKVAHSLAEFNLEEATVRRSLLELRKLLAIIYDEKKVSLNGERTSTTGLGYNWSHA